MNVQVLAIEPADRAGLFNVVVAIGSDQYQFTMTGETDTIGDRQIQVIQGDAEFWNLFQFNQHLTQKIYKLTAKIYNNEAVVFPAFIGTFFQREIEALALQKRQ